MYSVKLFIIATVFTILVSQLLRINFLTSSALNLTDVLVLTTDLLFVIFSLSTKKKITVPGHLIPAGVVFFILSIASSVFSFHLFAQKEVLGGVLFLVRLLLYTCFSVVVANTIKRQEVRRFLGLFIVTGFVFALFGLLQLVFFPSLTSLVTYGWDPHINRLVSSTLDPNFAGALLTIFACVSTSLYLFTNEKKYTWGAFIFSLAILLTYSRSSYIALLTGMFVIASVKSPKIILVPLLLFVISFLLVPTARLRIIGAFAIDDTARSRIQSWGNAVTIFRDHPVIGVGFNNYRFAQSEYGFFEGREEDGGHSGAGSDSSFLLVLATTGILGFMTFLAWQLSIVKTILFNIKKSPLALGLFASYVALLIHSQFVNSLFFPQILMSYMFLFGLKHAQDN